jgi:hypothetical protein
VKKARRIRRLDCLSIKVVAVIGEEEAEARGKRVCALAGWWVGGLEGRFFPRRKVRMTGSAACGFG